MKLDEEARAEVVRIATAVALRAARDTVAAAPQTGLLKPSNWLMATIGSFALPGDRVTLRIDGDVNALEQGAENATGEMLGPGQRVLVLARPTGGLVVMGFQHSRMPLTIAGARLSTDTQTINNNTATTVIWNLTVDAVNPFNALDTATGIVTIPVEGLWHFSAYLKWSTDPGNVRSFMSYFVNGASAAPLVRYAPNQTNSDDMFPWVTLTDYRYANDTVAFDCYQISGATRAIYGQMIGTFLGTVFPSGTAA